MYQLFSDLDFVDYEQPPPVVFDDGDNENDNQDSENDDAEIVGKLFVLHLYIVH